MPTNPEVKITPPMPYTLRDEGKPSGSVVCPFRSEYEREAILAALRASQGGENEAPR